MITNESGELEEIHSSAYLNSTGGLIGFRAIRPFWVDGICYRPSRASMAQLAQPMLSFKYDHNSRTARWPGHAREYDYE